MKYSYGKYFKIVGCEQRNQQQSTFNAVKNIEQTQKTIDQQRIRDISATIDCKLKMTELELNNAKFNTMVLLFVPIESHALGSISQRRK